MEPETDSPRRAMHVDISAFGIAAGYPVRIERRVLVAPSTGNEFNRLRPFLVTVGCALVPDHQFEFDSSFMLPNADKSFSQLVKLIQRMPDCPMSVFGHADPIGRDTYNKTLSGRRAIAVYAVLTRDTDLWDKKLYRRPVGGDRWGTRSLQVMLNAAGHPPGNLDGTMDVETRDAVEAFQTEHGLDPDRDPGPMTRGKLFEVYMDLLCTDENGQPFKVEKDAFLGGGADSEGKADYQGCGEFNPILIFSDEEHAEFSRPENRAARNEANASNRRVLVYLFERGTEIDPNLWPCPRATEGDTGCRRRFWSNGEERRARREPERQRTFQEDDDTFGCRFYHRLAGFSPCEAGLKLWVVRLRVDGAKGNIPLANRRFALTAGETEHAPIMRGTTDAEGVMRIPVYDAAVTMTLKLDASGYLMEAPASGDAASDDQSGDGEADSPPAGDTESVPAGEEWEGEDGFLTLTLEGGALLPIDSPAPQQYRQRLHNLGYGAGDPGSWDQRTELAAVRAFQRDHDLEPSGGLDTETREKIREEHGS